ncbi:MAG TPA: methyl-accepting chemotaxis protein [Desulfobacteria bacterium]|nr:methyl-accepting chemotaxis protein [Desulfobacteria bacterium]
MRKNRPYKRKMLNLSINRGMQFRMIGKIAGLLFISLMISSAFFFLYSNQEIGASFKMFHIKARSFLDMLLPAIIFSFLLSLILGVVVSLFFPKNYAGALFRIESDLKKVLCGDLTKKFTLRSGDDGQELVVQLNELTKNFRGKICELRHGIENIRNICSSDEGMSAEEQRLEVQKVCSGLLDGLAPFKVDEDPLSDERNLES